MRMRTCAGSPGDDAHGHGPRGARADHVAAGQKRDPEAAVSGRSGTCRVPAGPVTVTTAWARGDGWHSDCWRRWASGTGAGR